MTEPKNAAEARAEHESFMARFSSTLDDALKMKARMLERGLTEARVQCPKCEGKLHMRISGRKNHARMWCDGPCKRSMME